MIKRIPASLGLLAAVVLTVSTAAQAAPPTTPTTVADSEGGNSSTSAPGLTKAAMAAGRAAFGAKATTQQVLQAYWTPERMRTAKSVDSDPDFRKAVRAYEERSQKQKGSDQASQAGPVREVKSTSGTAKPSDGDLSFTGRASGTISRAPAAFASFTERTSGKVFFTKPGVGNFVCSGTVVNTSGRDAVWTAGHCVHGGEGSRWWTNWTFVPDYDQGNRPVGTWSARQLWSKGDWVNDSDFDEDMGVAIMNTVAGQHIQNLVGGQGFTVNRGKRNYEVAFGYPAGAPFDGQTLRRCTGTSSPEWDAWFVWSHTLKIPCNFTGGASGGGWFYGYNFSTGTGALNGVNSRADLPNPTIVLSPYFDDSAWSLYQATEGL